MTDVPPEATDTLAPYELSLKRLLRTFSSAGTAAVAEDASAATKVPVKTQSRAQTSPRDA
jgi:hypothetical protein